jgi:hypothetical protein
MELEEKYVEIDLRVIYINILKNCKTGVEKKNLGIIELENGTKLKFD